MGPHINDLSWSPESPEVDANVTVIADIVDINDVDAAWLTYDDGSGETDVVMTASGDTYSGVIPGISEGAIEFTVYANDTLGNTAIRGVYIITWGEETNTTAIDDTAPPPGDIDWMIVGVVGIGVVIVLIFVVLILKKR